RHAAIQVCCTRRVALAVKTRPLPGATLSSLKNRPRSATEVVMNNLRNVVLVHGGFVDGSGWQPVYDLLKADRFNVSVVQNPTLSLEGDVAATQQVIDAQDGP